MLALTSVQPFMCATVNLVYISRRITDEDKDVKSIGYLKMNITFALLWNERR